MIRSGTTTSQSTGDGARQAWTGAIVQVMRSSLMSQFRVEHKAANCDALLYGLGINQPGDHGAIGAQ
jgi:hypothetical protein